MRREGQSEGGKEWEGEKEENRRRTVLMEEEKTQAHLAS